MVSSGCDVVRGVGAFRRSDRGAHRRLARVRCRVVGALTASLILAGCGASRVTAPTTAPETALPSNYLVEYDSLLGTPRWVRNQDAMGAARPGEPAPFRDDVAFQIVRGFVLRYAAVFRLRPGTDDFAATWAQGHDGANFVKVQQTYRGLPVDAMGYGTMLLANGSVGSMIGRFLPDIVMSTTPAVRPAAATGRAIEVLAPIEVQALSPPRLTVAIVDEDLTPRLAWSVVVQWVGGFQSWTVTVDARDGAVLRVRQNWIEN